MNTKNEPQPKQTSRQKQAEETRQKLLQVSLDLVRKKGFDHVKIEDICREANASVGSFYHHFKNKAGIVVALYDNVDRHFLSDVIPALHDRDSVDAILDYLDAQLASAQQIGVDIGLQIYKAQLTEGTEFFLSHDRPLAHGLIQLIQHLQEVGTLRADKDAGQLGSELLVITRGILYNWCLCRGSYDSRTLAREMLSNYLQAYLCK